MIGGLVNRIRYNFLDCSYWGWQLDFEYETTGSSPMIVRKGELIVTVPTQFIEDY